MNSILVVLTSAFPFQNGEEFLLQETHYYHPFKKVYIIPIMARDYSKCKDIPSDIEVLKLSKLPSLNPIKKSFSCVMALRHKDVQDEISVLFKTGRFSIHSIRRLLVDSYKAHYVYQEIYNYIKAITEKYPTDGVVLYSYWMAIHAQIAVELKKRFRQLKIVTRCHGGDLYEYRYKPNYIPYRSSIFENEDKIITISENGEEYIRNTYNNYSLPVLVSRLGITPKYEIPTLNKGREISIVSCSYCIPLKRIDLIINALSEITDTDITWTHIGDGIELERLRSLSEKVMPSNVKCVFMGYVNNDEIHRLYSTGRYNVFINVSETEGIPVSIMEAMSYGLPIIATDVGGVSEMVIEGKNGFLLPKDFEIELLRKRIKDIIHMSSDSYLLMSNNSHRIWDDRFNADKNYTEFVNVLRML